VLSRDGQVLLPFAALVEQSRLAIDELVDMAGRATIEAVLKLSARSVAGERHQGRAGGEIVRHGSQRGVVRLSDRKLRVKRPRLRRKGGGEVVPPAYEAIRSHPRLGERMLEILMSGVSTRNYERVLPKMAETVGVSKSAISRKFVEVSAESLKKLCERDLSGLDLLALYVDGARYGQHVVVVAVGVDTQGKKHVLGLVEGSTENTAVCRRLLSDLVGRGVDPEKRHLFVIDGSKALRRGIDEVFGAGSEVQRCRNHKIRNVCDHVPKDMRPQLTSTMRAAYRLDAGEGMAKLKLQAKWLETEHPSAAASLLEGLEETFTVNRLGLSDALRRSFATTNLIENPHSAARLRTGRVTNWQDGSMVARWAAAAFLDAEKNFRKVMGYRDLWMLEAALKRKGPKQIAHRQEVA
jgi:transposase-like protein